ncbi:MAG: ABC transporter permease, partial [Candidatus Aminicenantes bacterium]
MFDLEKAIKQWRKSLRKNQAIEDGILVELESHLRDEFERQINLGMGAKEAFQAASRSIGSSDEIGTEFHKHKTRQGFMPDLIWNYFKLASRRIKRHKGFSFINIAGLAIGMACAIIILLWVQNELSYDKFHEKGNSLFRVAAFASFPNRSGHSVIGPPPLAPALKEEFPEIIQSTRVDDCPRLVFKNQDKVFYEQKGLLADPSFLEMFTFPLIQGNPQTALSDPFNIIITENTALKYFGDINPLAKTMLVEGIPVTVTGIMKNIPENSHMQFDFVMPFEIRREMGDNLDYWGNSNTYAYVQLHNQAIPSDVDTKIENYLKDKLATVFRMENPFDVRLYLQPITDIHL